MSLDNQHRYLVNDYGEMPPEVLAARFNELAEYGWRLIAVCDSHRFIFVKDNR